MKRKIIRGNKFTGEIDFYTVLILDIGDYIAPKRTLPDGFVFEDANNRSGIRSQEKKILQRLFDDWSIPFHGKLPGFRSDSAIYVVQEERLVGGVYLCDKNEFTEEGDAGQLHYAFMDPDFQGMGIYSNIFCEAVNTAKSWGLNKLYLSSDRYLLPDVYIRWGAKHWKTIPKVTRLPKNFLGTFLHSIKLSIRELMRKLRSRRIT